jgi:cellulose synthase/poly-beta-1,6-N-acetylglucosamine synthase-like glycosyltransferase
MSLIEISVIIPVHNGSPYIAATIAGVIDQTLPSTDILVVDDGSTDGSAKIAQAQLYAQRVRFIEICYLYYDCFRFKTLLQYVFHAGMRCQIRTEISKHNTSKLKIDPEIRMRLTQDYREEILQLQDMIHRDLSEWLL